MAELGAQKTTRLCGHCDLVSHVGGGQSLGEKHGWGKHTHSSGRCKRPCDNWPWSMPSCCP